MLSFAHPFNLLDTRVIANPIFICHVYSWWGYFIVSSTGNIVLFFVPGKKELTNVPMKSCLLFKWLTVYWPARTLLHVCNPLICVSSRIGENLEQSLPGLTELVLTSNNIQELVSAFRQQSV